MQGATITAIGADCLNWQFEDGLGGIVASWVISPCLSAVVGCTIYAITRKVLSTKICLDDLMIHITAVVGR